MTTPAIISNRPRRQISFVIEGTSTAMIIKSGQAQARACDSFPIATIASADFAPKTLLRPAAPYRFLSFNPKTYPLPDNQAQTQRHLTRQITKCLPGFCEQGKSSKALPEYLPRLSSRFSTN
jgi:hypothetical protein